MIEIKWVQIVFSRVKGSEGFNGTVILNSGMDCGGSVFQLRWVGGGFGLIFNISNRVDLEFRQNRLNIGPLISLVSSEYLNREPPLIFIIYSSHQGKLPKSKGERQSSFNHFNSTNLRL